MLGVSTAFKNFLFNRHDREPLIRAYFENTGVDAEHGLKAIDVEFTEFIRNFGSITRELDVEHGVFRAGSNSLQIKNTDDFGDYLFSLRKRYGDELWNDKTYHILFGCRKFPVASTVTATLPKMATLGFGEVPTYSAALSSTPATIGIGDVSTGEPSVESVTEEMVKIYTGDIQKAIYDRVGGTVNVTSKDFYQRLVDFKVCKLVQASDIFTNASGTQDTRGVQGLIRYGTHKFILRSSGENSPLSDRNSPFDVVQCVPNIETASGVSVATGLRAAYHIWYAPIENPQLSIGAVPQALFAASTLKLWYWDYIARIWRAFPASYFTNNYIRVGVDLSTVPTYPNACGVYFWVADPTNCKVGSSGQDTWAQYLASSGTYFTAANIDKLDVAVCAETMDFYTVTYGAANPIYFLIDLLTNARFARLTQRLTDLLDFYSFTSPNTDRTFDYALESFDDEGIDVNVAYSKDISVAKVIESICALTGMILYATTDYSASVRRCIKIKLDRAYNPCLDAPPNLLSFSTKDRLSNYETILSKDEKYDRVVAYAFEPSTSTRESYDILSSGSGNKVINLGSRDVYFYACSVAAQGIVSRLYNKFSKPTEILELSTDAGALIAELADYIKVHDHRLDEEIVAEIYRWQYDLKNLIKISARRYTKLFGPDENIPYKVYAFEGCACAGTNASSGSGSHASIASGATTITLSGETFDAGQIKIGMAIRVEDEMFWIKSITSTTALEVYTAAVSTHSDKTWSIGNSYHAR